MAGKKRTKRPSRAEIEAWFKLPETKAQFRRILADCERRKKQRRRDRTLTWEQRHRPMDI